MASWDREDQPPYVGVPWLQWRADTQQWWCTNCDKGATEGHCNSDRHTKWLGPPPQRQEYWPLRCSSARQDQQNWVAPPPNTTPQPHPQATAQPTWISTSSATPGPPATAPSPPHLPPKAPPPPRSTLAFETDQVAVDPSASGDGVTISIQLSRDGAQQLLNDLSTILQPTRQVALQDQPARSTNASGRTSTPAGFWNVGRPDDQSEQDVGNRLSECSKATRLTSAAASSNGGLPNDQSERDSGIGAEEYWAPKMPTTATTTTTTTMPPTQEAKGWQ